MFKTWLLYFLTLLATFIFFLFYKMWFSWFCLVILTVLPFAALILCIISAKTFDFTTVVPLSVHNNERSSIKINITGLASQFSFCRLKVTVRDMMSGSSTVPSVLSYARGFSEIPIDTDHCGSYVYKINSIRVYDMFGFFFSTHRCNKEFDVVVRPVPVIPKNRIDLSALRAECVRSASSLSSDLYDVREYRIGDSLKSVHWKASAKKDTLLVREPFEQVYSHSRFRIDLTDDREYLDKQLSEMMYTSAYCIDRELSHRIKIRSRAQKEVSFDIENRQDLEDTVTSILHMRVAGRT